MKREILCKSHGKCAVAGACKACFVTDGSRCESYCEDSLVKPKRIQRKRMKGWKMPPNTVSICRPGKFGNPFIITEDRSKRACIAAFQTWLTVDGVTAGIPEKKKAIIDGLSELRGKKLACYCKEGEPCHGDILLRLANETKP